MNDPEDIRAWQRLSPRITTSGRLEDTDPARLSELGVVHVINLALDDHPDALAEEGAKLADEGIDYTHIPVPFDAPSEDHYRRFAEALTEGETPVHVHCIMNWRVAAFFYRFHCEHGMEEPLARALMLQQWDPEHIDLREGPAWARFIKGEDS